MFDPLGEYLRPRLRLWRLPEPELEPQISDDPPAYAEVARGPHGLWSDVLGLWLAIDDEAGGALVRLRERDGRPVLRGDERAVAEAARAEAEAARAQAEAARAEAEAARADAEAARADAEANRADAGANRAATEADRAARAEAERDALLAEIARLRG